MIPPNPAPHITDWLLEIGPLSREGGQIGWPDLTAWQQISGIELEPWEGRLIRRLSGEYATMRIRAEKSDCVAPYAGEEKDMPSVRDRVAAKVSAMFGAG